MKKFLPFLIVGGLLVLAAGGWLYFSRDKTGVSEPEKVESFTGKLKRAITLGIPMKCTWTHNGFTDTGYIKGGKYYGEVTGEFEEEEKKGRVIIKDNCVWTWNEGEDKGIKMCFEPTEDEDNLWDIEGIAQGDYHCTPAVVDDAKFTPPVEVNFFEVGEMMEEIGQ